MSAPARQPSSPVAEVRGLSTRYGAHVVHEEVSLSVHRGEILAIVGGSGSGKSTLLREMALLERPTLGRVFLFGGEVSHLVGAHARELRRRLGVLFQQGALFGDLSVQANVALPLREHSTMSSALIDQIAAFKIALTGLEPATGQLLPNQLSGGMRKRAALARAIALDPQLLFLDEPTSGLDPLSAEALDELVLALRRMLDLTIVLVTHDLDSLWRVSDRVALLAEGRIVALDTMQVLSASDEPHARRFFQGPRGRAAQRQQAWKRG